MPVVSSLEDGEGLRCVAIIQRDDGTYTFKEFRKDPAGAGRWYLVHDYSNIGAATREETIKKAAEVVAWLDR